MAKKDFYEILGVNRDVSDADIKKAYRRLAMKHHPDRNTDDSADAEEKFKEAKQAYEVLSDKQKRNSYDQFGHAGVDQSAGGGAGPGFNSDIFGDVFGDVFGDIFGGGRGGGRNRVYRGADLRYNLELTLEEAVFGESINIRVPALSTCKTCNGSGAKVGTNPTTCATCGGAGQVRMQQGFFSVQQTCPKCRGQGKVISEPCSTCQGQGRTQENKTLSVKIPPGVDNSDRIRLSGEGEAGENSGPSGDLYVHVHIKPHPIFVREDSNLICEMPVSIATATLGGDLEVPTLKGRLKLKIPAETQSGRLFRMKGKGIKPVRGGVTGDLLCRVVVETPVKLNNKQKNLLKEFEQSLKADGKHHSPQSDSWMGRVKKFIDDLKM